MTGDMLKDRQHHKRKKHEQKIEWPNAQRSSDKIVAKGKVLMGIVLYHTQIGQ
jgi:hypothetical protein